MDPLGHGIGTGALRAAANAGMHPDMEMMPRLPASPTTQGEGMHQTALSSNRSPRRQARVQPDSESAGRRCRRFRRRWCLSAGIASVLLAITGCGSGGGGGGSDGGGGGSGGSVSVTSITLNKKSLLLEEGGDPASITATLHLSDGGTASPSSDVNWSITSGGGHADIVATDGTTATVKGVASGEATVRAASGGHDAEADVFVSRSLALQVRPSTLYLPPQCSEKITARLVTAEGVTSDVTGNATWAVSNSEAVSVREDNGGGKSVVAGNPGGPVTSVVSASYQNRRATGRAAVAGLDSIRLETDGNPVPDPFEVAQEEPRRLQAVGTFVSSAGFPDRQVTDTDCVDWNSSNTDVAIVSERGVVTGIAPGRTNVQAAHAGGTSATVGVKVEGRMTDFSLTPSGSFTLEEGALEQLKATGNFADGSSSDITNAVDWRSDSSSIASVSNETGSEGLVTAVAPGQAVVTASLGGVGEESVTVDVSSDPGKPGTVTVTAEPNVLLAGDETDTADVCARVISNAFEPLSRVEVDFRVLEGESKVDLSSPTLETDTSGKACPELSPTNSSTPGSVIVRAEEPESGLAESTHVELVTSFASVFDTSGDVEPAIGDDGTASKGTVFEAILENGSNRAFTLETGDVTFCNGSDAIDIGPAGVPSDSRIDAGDRVRISVELTKDSTTDQGFALVIDSDDQDNSTGVRLVHRFTEAAEGTSLCQ